MNSSITQALFLLKIISRLMLIYRFQENNFLSTNKFDKYFRLY